MKSGKHHHNTTGSTDQTHFIAGGVEAHGDSKILSNSNLAVRNFSPISLEVMEEKGLSCVHLGGETSTDVLV